MLVCLFSTIKENHINSTNYNNKETKINMDGIIESNNYQKVLSLEHKKHQENVVKKNGLVPFVAKNLPLNKKYENNLYDLCLKIAKVNINETCQCKVNSNYSNIENIDKKKTRKRISKLSNFVKKELNKDLKDNFENNRLIEDKIKNNSLTFYNSKRILNNSDFEYFDENEDIDFISEYFDDDY